MTCVPTVMNPFVIDYLNEHVVNVEIGFTGVFIFDAIKENGPALKWSRVRVIDWAANRRETPPSAVYLASGAIRSLGAEGLPLKSGCSAASATTLLPLGLA